MVRVAEFYDYSVSMKNNGPVAFKVYEETGIALFPQPLRRRRVQMVIKSYAPYRYGHCLYKCKEAALLTKSKSVIPMTGWMLPLSEFSSQP